MRPSANSSRRRATVSKGQQLQGVKASSRDAIAENLFGELFSMGPCVKVTSHNI